MTLSPRIYFRSNGAMKFWRLGRIGGSFYLSNNNPVAAREERVAAASRRRAAERSLRVAVRIATRRLSLASA